ncbi:type II toxin-antitoxin system RelE/ParE family toxin [Leptospira noguchii]|uniref:type II toxin-antitoxin system RelE family toxin n=1 Tax=Leptospira noguchii TaxID=28182 RepID=UPI000248BAD3|nr:type II toxin-antitoxin system RelE/ParE family toxin [Leptospira noguchii]EKR75119.1 plasmid stabilization system protein, RelE/ParE family [Leptospira noguchii str. 2006001870]TQE71595.1 type II toxin-antitoxin system RelE/ParE family toxin [Leptospira noguchii]UOG33022.1 type II toxin-antitoxin system RelE/ParE family toxin [Leptospira noguchii]UOG33032.1 type II toxin-antitoxin system RelE/ParE family toxin [Leptospira noguchii]UOG43832.1 type II toxin-antitoxin system RelE/ParE family 
MPEYSVLLSKSAIKQLDKLPDNITYSLIKIIEDLAKNPRPQGSKKLKGRNGFRIRKGNYRIIYEIFDQKLIVEVIAIGDRKEIYK